MTHEVATSAPSVPANNVLESALRAASAGFAVFPLVPGKKIPATGNGFKSASTDSSQITDWFTRNQNANIGIATGPASGVWVLDIDVKDGALGEQSFAELERQHGQLPATRKCVTASGGFHLYFKYPACGKIGNRAAVRAGIDVRGDGGYVVAPPSVVNGQPYYWVNESERIAEAPAWLLELVRGPVPSSVGSVSSSRQVRGAPVQQGGRNDSIMRFSVQQMRRGFQIEEVRVMAMSVNQTYAPPLDEEEVRQVVNGVFARYGSQVTAHCTDMGNAQSMAKRFGDVVRYVTETGAWLLWSGTYWVSVSHLDIVMLAKDVVTGLYVDAQAMVNGPVREALIKHALKSESENSLTSMIELFKSEPGIAICVKELDTNGDIFPAKNGPVDLRTGKLMAPQQSLYITKVSGVAYDSSATCPLWNKFLLQAMGNQQELVRFLKRAIGYSLTGSMGEQCLFFAYGYGANGKSTFLNVMRALFGDLGIQMSSDTLMDRKNRASSASGDIARLMGTRFAAVSEIEDGRQLSESLVKSITGGDPIMARYMYKDFFEFVPAFKVWIAANHKPTIRGTDEAIWRRLRFIPFETFIRPEDRDPNLERKLCDELPGILNWAIEGCLEWRQERLPVPQAIRNATDAYRSEMDVVGSWISEHCVVRPGLELCFDEGYKHFAPWCVENYNFAFSKKKLGMLLTERGFLKKSKPQRVYIGLNMRSELPRSQLDRFDKEAELNALKTAINAVPNDLAKEDDVE